MSPAIRIVLVDTSHPGNIGASARAMMNMGLESLFLVRPQAFPHPDAAARAAGAGELLTRARVVGSVNEAIGDCGLVLGTSARARSANWRMLDARTGAVEAVAAAAERPVAILFGGERSGLGNDELARCQALVRIPSAAAYESLNLAQAVQVICYEIHIARGRPAAQNAGFAPPGLATADEMLELHAHIERVMRASGFMHGGNSAQLGARMRRLVVRALPDAGEVRILRGWLAAIERLQRPAE